MIHCSGWVSALAPLYLRRKYADDPTFRDSKIVYALQPEKFEGTLDPRFAEKLLMNDFTEEDIAALGKDPVDFATLNRLAIDYADAVIQVTSDVDPALVEYARNSGKPFLPYENDEGRVEAYTDFYRSLIGEEED